MNVVGVDLSLTATGIADALGVSVFKTKAKGMERLDLIAVEVESHATAADTVVYIEGYSYGSPNQAHHLGELGGVVRCRLWNLGIAYHDVAPPTVKKFATGKGNARKPDMLDAARREGYEGTNDDNAVDAWWLRQFGLYVANEPAVSVFAYRDTAVATGSEKAS